MASEFRCLHRVQFSDTDMAGIMHFANFFRYMEETEHAFFRSIGLSVHMEDSGSLISWPRVHAECDYKAPLRFEDEFEVRLVVREKRDKALVFDFQFLKPNSEVEFARGSVTAVCVTVNREAGTMRAVSIPPAISQQIEAADSTNEPEG